MQKNKNKIFLSVIAICFCLVEMCACSNEEATEIKGKDYNSIATNSVTQGKGSHQKDNSSSAYFSQCLFHIGSLCIYKSNGTQIYVIKFVYVTIHNHYSKATAGFLSKFKKKRKRKSGKIMSDSASSGQVIIYFGSN